MTSTKSRKVFLSYGGVEPIDQVAKAIRQRGLQPFSSYDLPVADPLLQTLQNELGDAEFAIFVIADQRGALNAAVELGVALAAGLPTLILAAPGTDLPAISAGLPVLRTSIDRPQGLDQALAALEEFATERPRTAPPRQHSLGSHVEDLIEQWRAPAVSDQGDDRRSPPFRGPLAEAIVAEVFRQSGIRAIREPSGISPEADFVVWDASLEPYVGAPLLVEVVSGRWSARRLNLKIRQLGEFVSGLPSGRWGLLVLAMEEGEEPIGDELISSQPVLVIGLTELLESMRGQSFADVVRQLRNERVHS